MDRRSFFRTMVGGVATAAAVRQWPFRVYSFPSQLLMPDVVPGDIIIPYNDLYSVGQRIAIYSSAGLERGCYQVKSMDVAGRRIHLQYVSPEEFRRHIASLRFKV